MSRRSPPRLLRVALLLPFVAGCVPPGTDPTAADDRAQTHALLSPDATFAIQAQSAGGYPSSVDRRGVPTFIWAGTAEAPPSGSSHEAAARFHSARFANALGLRPEALAVAEPFFVSDRGEGGVVVQLRQRVGGVAVYGRELRLLMRKDHSLVALSGGLHPSVALSAGAAFVRTPEAALAGALSHAAGADVAATSVIDLHESDGDQSYYQLRDAGDLVVPERALVRKVLYPERDHLRPAYAMDFYVGRATELDATAWRYVIAADDGKLLERRSLTQYDAFNYRVWANTAGDKRPLDGPIADWTPHPTGHADWSYPPFVPPPLITMEGFNKNPQGHPDPWLAPSATETVGNNVDAYTDRNPPEGLSGADDFRASLTGPLAFDRVYDLNDVPTASTAQAMAGVTQVFYDNNWLHDYWYDSGFTEAAGNAQGSNYGRGGVGGDKLQISAQYDVYGGTRDNSNMSTPGDGLSPRMRVFVWSGREARILHATPPDADLSSASAAFGPTNFQLSGILSEIDDGTFPSITDACEPIRNDITGKIAIVDRGSCTFKRKSVNVENAGGIGILIVNNVSGDPPSMGNGDPMSTTVNIPVLSTSKPDGTSLRARIASGPVTLKMGRTRDIDRDGTLDNTVIFHEWGHYLHHRLADCGAAKQCNAMSEGWADFNALHTIARDTDNLDGVYALAIYASIQFDDPAYFGIRRQPYTTDFRKNGLTFKDIADSTILPVRQVRNGGGPNSEVHNAGEVWATMMWEAYVALQKAGRARSPSLSFDQVRRRMADYVVVGHQMEPADATYTESRDALMAAAGAADADDQRVIAEAFARRGAGTCADSPARSSETFEGVVEGFKVQPRLVVGDVTLDDSVKSCDHDGVLDSGEQGKIVINLSNGALAPLVGATVTLSTTTPEVTFLGPTTFTIPTLAPFASTKITTQVACDPAMANPGTFHLKIQPSKDAACDANGRDLSWKINYDLGKATTATDDVEAPDTEWTLSGMDAASIWSRIPDDAQNRVWHGADVDGATDTALESPDLYVSPTRFFVIRFEHRYSFQATNMNNVRVFFDGGMVEISNDGGKTWQDISGYANPGYGGTITKALDNPLAGRNAFVDKNFGWPKRDRVTMNLLDTFAGQTVRLRFRIATDGQTGDVGWDIDNIAFQGIDNTPFTGVVYDAGTCGIGLRGPAANPMGGGCGLAARRASPLGALALMAPLALLAIRRRRRA